MIITSRQNAIIKAFKKPEGAFVVESEKLIREAVAAGFVLQHLLYTEKSRMNLPGIGITPDLSEYISDTKSPQGVFAMFERREYSGFEFTAATRVMLLDGIQDPGNVGAIIRSCEAFGFDCVICSRDCADVYNSKVIRASAGSVFRLPSVKRDLYEAISELKRANFKIYAAALDEDAVPLRQLSTVNCQLSTDDSQLSTVIGNEGRGVSQSVMELCDSKVYIPIRGAESLNAAVAAGIIAYEIGRTVS